MSSESERAEYYESHKDDPDLWGEPEPAKPRRRLASMISVRLSPDEAEAIREAADREGLSVSAFLRAAALKEARQEDGPRARPNPVAYVVNVPATYNWSDVAVTVLSASNPQDIEKIGGRGLSAQSTVLGGR
jgi:hypothetical protein